MAGSSGGTTQGKGFYFLLFALFAVALFVFGVIGRGFFLLLLGLGFVALVIVLVTVRFTDSQKNDEQRRADAEGSQLKNMDPAPPRPTLRSGKRNWAKYMLTHGEPIPGPADLHIPHDEYHHLATDERYQGQDFAEDGPHMLDTRRRERGEDQDS